MNGNDYCGERNHKQHALTEMAGPSRLDDFVNLLPWVGNDAVGYTYTLRIGSSGSPVPVHPAPVVSVCVIVQPTYAGTNGNDRCKFTNGATLDRYTEKCRDGARMRSLEMLLNGSYTVSVRDTNDTTCVSTGSAITIDAEPTAPSVPTVASTVQPDMRRTNGMITFTAQAGVEYSVGGAFQVTAFPANLAPVCDNSRQ